MIRGPILTAIIAGAAMSVVVVAFSRSASPYVTIAEAKNGTNDHMHVAGELIKESLHTDIIRHVTTFDLKDATGTIHVEYSGEPQPNLPEATKVVAVGGVQGDKLVSHQLLVKCPSKYEEKERK